MAGIGLLMPETHLLQLNGCVVNLKSAAHDAAELFQNLMPIIAAANHSVAAHGMDSRRQSPDMEIVD
jgi:hypothetical protein